MKKLLLSCLLLCAVVAYCQKGVPYDLGEYKPIPQNYEQVADKFKKCSKEALSSLRGYLKVKQVELDGLEEKISTVESDRILSLIDTLVGQEYLSRVDSAKPGEVVGDDIIRYLAEFGYMPEFYGTRKISDLRVITERVRRKVRQLKKDNAILSVLYESHSNVSADIQKAEERIDKMYGELYDEGNFKMWITSIFSLSVGGLLIFFFIFITKRAETILVKDFLASGNGLQFITLFSLVIAIILFGVLGILEGRELAAILSGISGYILGKGINMPAKRGGDNEQSQQGNSTGPGEEGKG